MKVALVIIHADAHRGGAERYTIDLSRALIERGCDASVLATSFAPLPPGVEAVALDAPGMTRTGRYRSMLRSLDALLAIARYDIVHAMFPVNEADIYHPHAGLAADAIRGRGASALFNPRRRVMASVERKLLSRSDGPVVLSLSEYVKRSIRHTYPALETNRIATLFNAVDLDRFEPPASRVPAADGVLRALFVGQDFARKGLLQAAAALELLDDLEVKLTVVGRRDHRFTLPSSAAQKVEFVGERDPRPFYASSDFLVLPTRHDPCSLVVLEALVSGLPVISTKQNGATEAMIDAVHGFVLPDPFDVAAIATAMRKMAEPSVRSAMSDACVALRPQLSFERHVDRLISIYRDRLAANRRSA